MFPRHHKSDRVKTFLKGAFLGGFALGLTALLFAPKSGKKLRTDIKKGCRVASKKAKDAYHTAYDSAQEISKEAKKTARRLFKR